MPVRLSQAGHSLKARKGLSPRRSPGTRTTGWWQGSLRDGAELSQINLDTLLHLKDTPFRHPAQERWHCPLPVRQDTEPGTARAPVATLMNPMIPGGWDTALGPLQQAAPLPQVPIAPPKRWARL